MSVFANKIVAVFTVTLMIMSVVIHFAIAMIERLCLKCNKRIKPDSKLKIYCKCDQSDIIKTSNAIDGNMTHEQTGTKQSRPPK